MARNAKPDDTKVVTGTFRKDRSKKNQSNNSDTSQTIKLPTVPRGMSKEGKKYFKLIAERMAEAGTIHGIDDLMLAATSEAYAEFMRCSKYIQENGSTFEFINSKGETVQRQRPEVKLMNDSWNRFFSVFKAFGLTHQSRVNLGINLDKQKPKSSKWEGFRKKNPFEDL